MKPEEQLLGTLEVIGNFQPCLWKTKTQGEFNQTLVSQIRFILDKLNPIPIYGYYYGGYNYTYEYKIVCAALPTKADAFEQALCAAGMLIVSKLDSDARITFPSCISSSPLVSRISRSTNFPSGILVTFTKWVRQQLETGWV